MMIHTGSLQHVNLSDNRLKDADIQVLLTSLTSAKSQLFSLDLSQNDFGSQACKALSEFIAISSRLGRLGLSGCHMATPLCVQLADAMSSSCPTLTLLDVSHNTIRAPGAVALAKLLKVRLRVLAYCSCLHYITPLQVHWSVTGCIF